MRLPNALPCQSLWLSSFLLIGCLIPSVVLGQAGDASLNSQAKKAFDKASQYERAHQYSFSIDSYKKANKLANGKCVSCLVQLCNLYRKTGDDKHSAEAAAQLGQTVTSPEDKATACILDGAALLREGNEHKKRELFQQADAQFKQALQFQPDRAQALFLDGLALGRVGDDSAAKAALAQYVASKQADPMLQARARRYIEDPSLMREKMAPAFSVRTLQGNTISLDNLQGKVVLFDFWATWCGPCNQELPHVERIAKQFQGQPFIVLSVSIDKDSDKWRPFVAQHGMSWPQYWDGDGVMATTFGVHEIPHYFTIDSQGVLRSEDMGSGADIDWRLKKLVARAQKMEEQPPARMATAGQ